MLGGRIESWLTGSPPQAWGQPVPWGSPAPMPPVHPHRRGDNFALPVKLSQISRFTPTGVGTTPQPPGRSRAFLPVHPHRRGDNPRSPLLYRRRSRFTPTGVGITSYRSHPTHPPARFTPTGVGTTPERLPGGYSCRTVHPHRRGDNVTNGATELP